ncbi:hypothetical protein D3C75_964920 [compost metagenome]
MHFDIKEHGIPAVLQLPDKVRSSCIEQLHADFQIARDAFQLIDQYPGLCCIRIIERNHQPSGHFIPFGDMTDTLMFDLLWGLLHGLLSISFFTGPGHSGTVCDNANRPLWNRPEAAHNFLFYCPTKAGIDCDEKLIVSSILSSAVTVSSDVIHTTPFSTASRRIRNPSRSGVLPLVRVLKTKLA